MHLWLSLSIHPYIGLMMGIGHSYVAILGFINAGAKIYYIVAKYLQLFSIGSCSGFVEVSKTEINESLL